MVEMQAMTRYFLCLLTVLLVTGCVSSGYGKPWERPAYARPAESAPSTLSRENTKPASPSGGIQQVQTAHAQIPQTFGHRDLDTVVDSSTAPPSIANQQPDSPISAVPAPPPVKVGLLVPLSGPQAHLGQAMLQAAQLALFDMGYDSFELLPRDTMATEQGGQKAAQDAINAGAQLLLGPIFASAARGARPVAQRYNINMISFSTDWTLSGGNTFIMGFLPFSQVQRVTEYAASQGYRRISVLAPDNEYGNAAIAAYNASAWRNGITTGQTSKFPANAKDVTGVVRAFTNYDAREPLLKTDPESDRLPFDAVFMPVGGEQARAVSASLSYFEAGPRKVRRLGTGLMDDRSLAAEPSLEGTWFATSSPELRRDFERRYRETYGQPAPRLVTMAYDATALAAVLARNGYYTMGRPAFDRESLINPNGFSGIDGIFRFRPDGMVERGLAILEFKNGESIQIDPAPRTFEGTMSQ